MINNFESFFYQFHSTIENSKSAFDKVALAGQNTIEKTQLLQKHFLQVQEDLNQLLDIKAKVERLSIDELYRQECPIDAQDEAIRHIQYVSFVEFAQQEKNELLSQIQLVSQHTIQWLDQSQTTAGLYRQKVYPSLSHQIVNLLTLPFNLFHQSINYLWFGSSPSTTEVSPAKINSSSSVVNSLSTSAEPIDSVATQTQVPFIQDEPVNLLSLQPVPQEGILKKEEGVKQSTISPPPVIDTFQRPPLKDRLSRRTPPPLPSRNYKKALESKPAVENQGNKEAAHTIENLPISQVLIPLQNPPVENFSAKEEREIVQSQASKDLEIMISPSQENEAKMELLEKAHKTDSVARATTALIPPPPPFILVPQPKTTTPAIRSKKTENSQLTDHLTNSLFLRRSRIDDEEPESPSTTPSTPLTPFTKPSFNDIDTHPSNAVPQLQIPDPINDSQKPIEQDRGSLLDSIINFNKSKLKAVTPEEKTEDKPTFASKLAQSISNLDLLNADSDSESDFDSDLEDW